MNIKLQASTLVLAGLFLSAGPSLWAYQPYQSDQGIESSISNSYVFNNYLKGDNIVVHSQDGRVTLTGTVADENHKFLAQNIAENQPDIKSVDNELQVKSLPSAYSNAWIGIKVKAVLLFHRDVSAIRTQVDVKDGVVTLNGEADNEAQKELTGEYAKDVDGVKGVVNNMAIKPMEQKPTTSPQNDTIDDASITAQVKLTLLMHQSTSAINTHVKVENGKVTLTGTASNDAEKSLVTKLVHDINGVKSVDNDMDIKP